MTFSISNASVDVSFHGPSVKIVFKTPWEARVCMFYVLKALSKCYELYVWIHFRCFICSSKFPECNFNAFWCIHLFISVDPIMQVYIGGVLKMINPFKVVKLFLTGLFILWLSWEELRSFVFIICACVHVGMRKRECVCVCLRAHGVCLHVKSCNKVPCSLTCAPEEKYWWTMHVLFIASKTWAPVQTCCINPKLPGILSSIMHVFHRF